MFSDSSRYDDYHYVHKYYLPIDIKGTIFPVDIGAITYSDESSVTIYYKDLKLEKQVDADTCRRVRTAWQEYRQDCSADLSPDEEAYCVELNDRLVFWQRQVFTEITRLEEEMESRLAAGGGFAEDYEIDVVVHVFLRDDVALRNRESDQGDWDLDATMIARLELHKAMVEDYPPEFKDRDCWLFRHLYESVGIPLKHLCRIGSISTDIRVRLQKELSLNHIRNRSKHQSIHNSSLVLQ
jgi:hypothetical protein